MAEWKQSVSDVIDLLTAQTGLMVKFQGRRLYGEVREEEQDTQEACRVYKLSNETGTGKIIVHQVFTGIELYYNHMHMSYCNQNQATAKNVIEINHCCAGRYECSFGENSCCYMTAGDLSIGSLMRKKSFSSFPLGHYHGITVLINLEELLPEVRKMMELLNIDLDSIQNYICGENRCCIMRANPSVEHLFFQLYHVKDQRKAGYMKIKVLELLLFLSDLDTAGEVQQTEYYSQSQVKRIKAVAAYLTQDLTRHDTIEQLAKRFEISPTALKKCFRGVYGTSIYSYLRIYRLQAAQKMLLETDLRIGEIANRIGYENPNKFTSSFKAVYGVTPSEFRKGVPLCVHLDRYPPLQSLCFPTNDDKIDTEVR